VDFWFIGVDEGGIASHWCVGCTLAKRSSPFAIGGDCLAGADIIVCHSGVACHPLGLMVAPRLGWKSATGGVWTFGSLFESAGGLGLLSMLEIFGGVFHGLSRSKGLGGG
jgi:hypothetical protein